MTDMTTEQKALALKALGNFEIKIRSAGNWYVSVGAEIKRGNFLESPTVSEPTPTEAIEAMFSIYSAPGARVVLSAGRHTRREVTWNGFMWEDMP